MRPYGISGETVKWIRANMMFPPEMYAFPRGTQKQFRFAKLLALGVKQSKAYKLAGYRCTMRPSSVHTEAYRLRKHSKVQNWIAMMRGYRG